jgi:GNAT superfamily N-acetyltransferase
MDYSLKTTDVSKLNLEQKVQLGRLSRRGALLSNMLTYMLGCVKAKVPVIKHRIILAHQGDTILGWALLYIEDGENATYLMMYVRSDLRGQGIGRSLAHRARLLHGVNHWPTMKVYIVDDHHDFYARIGLVKQDQYTKLSCGSKPIRVRRPKKALCA